MGNLFHEVERVASAQRDDVAFDCIDGRAFTFANLLANAAAYSAALTSLGVRTGDRVTVQLEKSIEGVWLYLAVLRCRRDLHAAELRLHGCGDRVLRYRRRADIDRRGAIASRSSYRVG